MRKCSRFIPLLSIVFSVPLSADVCSDAICPNGRQPTTICYVDPETSSGILWSASKFAACGYYTEIVIAKEPAAIEESLKKLARSCKILDRMTLFGHGNDGYIAAGETDRDSIRALEKYGCLFNEQANIDFIGCNVGRGCAGDMLMFQTAKSLLHKGGTVTAPTFYASTFLPGVIPHTSLNLKNRVLEYKPFSKPPDRWDQAGLALGDGGDINKRCAKDLGELIEKADRAWDEMAALKCRTSLDSVYEKNLASYRDLKNKLADGQTVLQTAPRDVWIKMNQAYINLTFQVAARDICSRLEKDSKKSRADK